MDYLPTLWTTHSCWHNGHLLFCTTHSDIQQLWNEWLHSPHTTTHSSCLLSDWQRRQASMTCTLQIAHVSHSTSHDHIATAFHFFKVNIFCPVWSLAGVLSSIVTSCTSTQDVSAAIATNKRFFHLLDPPKEVEVRLLDSEFDYL